MFALKFTLQITLKDRSNCAQRLMNDFTNAEGEFENLKKENGENLN